MKREDFALADLNRPPSMDLEEMIPVDQFFNAYVSQLEAGGTDMFGMPGLDDPVPPPYTNGTGNFGGPGFQQPNYQTPPNLTTGPFDAPHQPLAGVPIPEEKFSSQAMTHMQYQQMAAANQNMDGLGGLVPIPTPFARSAPHFSPTTPAITAHPNPNARLQGNYNYAHPRDDRVSSAFGTSSNFGGSSTSNISGCGSGSGGLPMGQVPPFSQDLSMTEGIPQVGGLGAVPEAELDRKGVKKGGRTRNRSVRQQLLNKQAQQRYRERKKQKAVELETAVESLTVQVDNLKGVQEEKKALEDKTMELERRLLEKEAEVQRVKAELTAKKSSEKGSNCSDISSADLDYDKEHHDYAAQYHAKVDELRTAIRQYGVEMDKLSSPHSSEVPERVVAELRKRVDEICMLCMRATRLDGPDLWELITANADRDFFKPHEHERWVQVAESLKLSEEQRRKALLLREQHTERLNKVYLDRQALNLEAIGMLLPGDQGGQAATRQFGCFSISSFIQRARHSSKTHKVLDKLRSNLREEQRAVSELEYMTFHRVMNPIQGAWFTLHCYPHHCDCLSLLNAVHELSPKAGEASRTASKQS